MYDGQIWYLSVLYLIYAFLLWNLGLGPFFDCTPAVTWCLSLPSLWPHATVCVGENPVLRICWWIFSPCWIFYLSSLSPVYILPSDQAYEPCLYLITYLSRHANPTWFCSSSGHMWVCKERDCPKVSCYLLFSPIPAIQLAIVIDYLSMGES